MPVLCGRWPNLACNTVYAPMPDKRERDRLIREEAGKHDKGPRPYHRGRYDWRRIAEEAEGQLETPPAPV